MVHPTKQEHTMYIPADTYNPQERVTSSKERKKTEKKKGKQNVMIQRKESLEHEFM